MADLPKDQGALTDLRFTVTGRISRPCEEVYECVADPAKLSQYFTTGGASGRLEVGKTVTWDFHDFPGAFPVTVLAAEPPRSLTIAWGGAHSSNPSGSNQVDFKFEPLDGNTRTLVTITEAAWLPTPAGAQSAFGNCEGWTGMLLGLRAWVEHGVVLREGYYR